MQNDFYIITSKIDNLMTHYSMENLDNIESYFESNKGVEEYFLRKLADNNFDPNPWFESLHKRNYFNPKNNPRPYKKENTTVIPFWNVLPILENIATKNREYNKHVGLLIEILNNIIENEEDNSIENIITDYSVTKIIGNLPPNMITKKHFEFIRSSLKYSSDSLISGEIKDVFLPKFVELGSKELILQLLDIMLDYKKVGSKYASIMDDFWLYESLKLYKGPIFKICGIEASNIAIDKIKSIIKTDPWQPYISAIDDHPQNLFIDKYDYQLVFFLRDFYENSDPLTIQTRIRDHINEDNPIFKRIAIHTINYHYSDLKEIFWKLNGNPLEIFGLRHEIYMLLKNNFSFFKEYEVNKLVMWIENVEYYISESREYTENEKEKIEAYEKLRWLDAVKELDNEKIQNLYRHYSDIYSDEMDHPDFDVWHGSTKVLKPIKPKNLCTKSNIQIARQLNKFDQEEKLLPNFDDSGFYESFSKCVSDNPIKFSKSLEPFLQVSRKSQHDLLDGLVTAWRNGENFNWDNILIFISELINSKSFWDKKYNSNKFKYRDWIISSIANLITERTKTDDRPLEEDLLHNVCEILIILSNRTNSKFNKNDDLVTSVLNSPKGQIYHAMINFSLSFARLYRKEEQEKWLDCIKLHFENNLDNPSIEFSAVLGEYLPQIFYLDKKWAIKNIDRIFSIPTWKELFTGYLFHSNIYGNIYKLLREKGYYEKAIYTNFEDKYANDSIVNHICTAYLFDIEGLDDQNSLITKLIYNKNTNQWQGIIRFFLMQKKDNYEIAKSKFRPLWQVLFELILRNPDYFKAIISEFTRILMYFDKIDDEVLNWIMLSVKYLNPNDLFFTKYLMSNVKESPESVAKIFIEMLSYGSYPEYQQDTIKEIVMVLYENGFKKEGNRISNFYGERGDYFLRELYIENNIS